MGRKLSRHFKGNLEAVIGDQLGQLLGTVWPQIKADVQAKTSLDVFKLIYGTAVVEVSFRNHSLADRSSREESAKCEGHCGKEEGGGVH
jgi:hypothetical protein